MSWYYYEDAYELKADVRRSIAKRKKQGEKFEKLSAPTGRKLTHTFWGTSWCSHLESHQDYENRLPRGRSYLRKGCVYDLSIEQGRVTSVVEGSYLYDVSVKIQPLLKADWERIKTQCAGGVASLLDLLGGKLGEGVLRTISDHEHGLFPRPSEIRFSCSCPDDASMCKHVAATLYGVGVKLDADPNLFFVLRSVDPSELLSGATQQTLQDAQGADAALAGEDLGALFGIDLAEGFAAPTTPAEPPAEQPRAKKAGPKAMPGKTTAQTKTPARTKKQAALKELTPGEIAALEDEILSWSLFAPRTPEEAASRKAKLEYIAKRVRGSSVPQAATPRKRRPRPSK